MIAFAAITAIVAAVAGVLWLKAELDRWAREGDPLEGIRGGTER